jgi:hypothetical protein
LPGGKNVKPQAKHLQTRVEYLLKVLGKHADSEKPPTVSTCSANKLIKTYSTIRGVVVRLLIKM